MLIINHPLVKIRYNYYITQNHYKDINTELYELDDLTYNILPKYILVKEDSDVSFHWKTENYLYVGSYYWWEKWFIDLDKDIIIKNKLPKNNNFKKTDIRIKQINDKEYELWLDWDYKITKAELKKIWLEELVKYKNKKIELFLFKPWYEINDLEKKLTEKFLEVKKIIKVEYVITFDRLKEYLNNEEYEEILKEVFNNKKQQEEWIELGFINKIDYKSFDDFKKFVKDNNKLPIDTKYFDKEWIVYKTIHRLWNTELYDKDNKLDWILIKWDNYHALNRLLKKWTVI